MGAQGGVKRRGLQQVARTKKPLKDFSRAANLSGSAVHPDRHLTAEAVDSPDYFGARRYRQMPQLQFLRS